MSDQYEQAIALQASGEFDQARTIYSNILKQDPGHLSSLINLGAISFATEQLDTAVQCYSIALKLDPDLAEVYYNRGCARHVQAQTADAEDDYRHCLKLQPDHLSCLENLIALLHQSGRSLPELKNLLRRRLTFSRDVDYLILLGNTCSELGDDDDALAFYQEAQAASPLNPAADYFLSTRELKERPPRFLALASRWSVPGFTDKNPARIVPLPMWQGDSLRNRHLYISAEQGLGDQVRFTSALPSLAARTITCEVDPRLVAPMARSFPDLEFIASAPDITCIHDIDWLNHDVFCYAADLPGLYRPQDESIEQNAWLLPETKTAKHWDEWLSTFAGLKVGLSWQGGSSSSEASKRSLSLTDLAPLFQSPGSQFLSVQYDPDMPEVARFNESIPGKLIMPPGLDCRDDIDGLLALLSRLDLVITIDNATAHLAAAVGTPVWVLLPDASDWRWSTSGPWLGNTTKFQNQADWQLTVKQVALALLEFKPGPGSEIQNIQESSISITAPPRPEILILNDSINHGHWGYGIASLWLHQSCQQYGYNTSSLPIQGLLQNAERVPPVEEFAAQVHWQTFLIANPQLENALDRCEKVIVDGEVSTEPLLLLYLAYGVKRFHDKSVLWLNHQIFSSQPEPALQELLTPIYRCFDHVVSTNPVNASVTEQFGLSANLSCNLLPLALTEWSIDRPLPELAETRSLLLTATDNTTVEYLDALKALCSQMGDHVDLYFLTGARAGLNPDDIITMQVLEGYLPGQIQVVRAMNEMDWLRCISQSDCIVSGQQHHIQAAEIMGCPAVNPLLHGSPAEAVDSSFSSRLQPEVIDWLKLSGRNQSVLGQFLDTKPHRI